MAIHGVPIQYFEFTYASDGGASIYKELIKVEINGEVVREAKIEFDEIADIASYVEYKRRFAFTSYFGLLSDQYDELWPEEEEHIKRSIGEEFMTTPTIIEDDPHGRKFEGPEHIVFEINKLKEQVKKFEFMKDHVKVSKTSKGLGGKENESKDFYVRREDVERFNELELYHGVDEHGKYKPISTLMQFINFCIAHDVLDEEARRADDLGDFTIPGT